MYLTGCRCLKGRMRDDIVDVIIEILKVVGVALIITVVTLPLILELME